MINRDLNRLNEEWSPGRMGSAYSPPSVPAPPAAEPGEMSREAFERLTSTSISYVDMATWDLILRHEAALRARAEREAYMRQHNFELYEAERSRAERLKDRELEVLKSNGDITALLCRTIEEHEEAIGQKDNAIVATLARAERERQYKERLRGECVGTLTDVGIYMLVEQDPTADGEVASAIRRLARERDEAREQREEERRGRIEVAAAFERVRDRLWISRDEDRALEDAEAVSLAAIESLRSRLATAEAYHANHDCSRLAQALSDEKAEVARLKAEQTDQEHLGKLVAAAGNEVMGRENAALRQRCERLEKAGEPIVAMARYYADRFRDADSRFAAWDAARGEKGGA